MKRIIKILSLWFILGVFYFALEGLWRLPKGGYANVLMLFVGGICAVSVGSINQVPKFYNMPIYLQSLIGTIITVLVEFISGYILNIRLEMHIWDYSNLKFNLLGQISLEFSILWFLLLPTCIWLEDQLRYLLWKEGHQYSLKSIYLEFITLK